MGIPLLLFNGMNMTRTRQEKYTLILTNGNGSKHGDRLLRLPDKPAIYHTGTFAVRKCPYDMMKVPL